MSKKDIEIIVSLSNNYKTWPLSQKSQVKYSYYRVKNLITELNKIKKLHNNKDNKELPEDYLD